MPDGCSWRHRISHGIGSWSVGALLLGIACMALADPAMPLAPSPLMQQLDQRIEQWRSALPDIRDSAQQAADSVLAGGKLYLVGYYSGWAWQAEQAPGRLTLLEELPNGIELNANDILLVTVYGWEDVRYQTRLQQLFEVAQASDAKVFVLAAAERMVLTGTNKTVRLIPDKPFDANRQDQPKNRDEAIVYAGLATAGNRFALHAWLRAFQAACVKRGQYPTTVSVGSASSPALVKVDPRSPEYADADSWPQAALNQTQAELARILRDDGLKLDEIAAAMRQASTKKQRLAIARRSIAMLEDDLLSPVQGNWFSFMPAASVAPLHPTLPLSPCSPESQTPYPTAGLWFQGIQQKAVTADSLKPVCDRWFVLPVRDDLPGIPQAAFWLLIEKANAKQP